MRALTALIVLAVLLAGCGGAATTQTSLVDPTDASELIDSDPETVVLDIRTPEEVDTGTLPRALNIDFYSPSFREEIAELDRDATYVVYCRSGNRTEQATRIMADLGFTDVYELDGGVVAWLNDGRSLIRG